MATINHTKIWRESASLILATKCRKNPECFKLLTFIRPEKSSFMPNSVVFPGGAFEESDQSKEWDNYFKKFCSSEQLNDLVISTENHRPSIYNNNEDQIVKKDISLRIAAIRETFEELGILLCRNKDELKSNLRFAQFNEYFNRKKWQKDVHNNPKNFLKLCKFLNVIPDAWCLYEWSNWLTPNIFPKKFDTAFYFAALEKEPNIIAEEIEVVKAMWKTPQELLEMFSNKSIWLPPPQLYEISRLANIKKFEDIVNFAKYRNKLGTTQFLPVVYKCSDGMIYIFPEDDLYPKNQEQSSDNFDNNKFVNKTIKDVRKMAEKLHRCEVKSLYSMKYFLNFKPLNGHLSPVGDSFFKPKL